MEEKISQPTDITKTIGLGSKLDCKLRIERELTTRTNGQTSRARTKRDSSLDSGIHHTQSDSDHDEITEAVNSRLCFADSVRLSPVGCNETDNLVEEVYIVGHNRSAAVVEDGACSMSSFSDDSLVEKPVKKTQTQIYIASQPQISNDTNVEIISDDDDKSVSASLSSNSSNDLNHSSSANRDSTNIDSTELKCVEKLNFKELKADQQLPVNVVVAIDLGTTYSGYAFRYINHPTDQDIHMMRNSEGEPGLNNQKSPTIILLDPKKNFHSFGCAARDYFHDLEPSEAQSWYYFDKFKMTLHSNTDVHRNSILCASNGSEFNALTVFSYALKYFKTQAMNELQTHNDRIALTCDEVQWVITVPAIWSHSAKQFIREAAFKAGLFLPNHPERLLIALEPEAAAIWCRSLRTSLIEDANNNSYQSNFCYMVVDCGGGTVDITVHQLNQPDGSLQELHKATGGSCGSLGVDEEFDRLLGGIFGFGFMSRLKLERPAAFTELMLSFESRKRTASPHRHSSMNISPPYSFIDHFRKVTGKEVETVIESYGRPEIKWSSQGCIRLHSSLMAELFRPTVERVIQHIESVLSNPRVSGLVTHLYLVGGFAESQILQQVIRQNFSSRLKVIIPQGVALSVLRGAVLFGLNPKVVSVRQARHTYGIGVLRKFQDGIHPVEKLVIKDGQEWCVDVLDPLVKMNQTVRVGEMVIRRYTPATNRQSMIVLHIYCAQTPMARFVTDDGVRRIGTLKLDLAPVNINKGPREIIARLTFGGTEVTASAFDTASQQYVDTDLSFLV